MKKGKNRKKVALLVTGLAVLALTAGTFAWTSYTEWTKNHMQSKGFESGRVTVVEDFKPETPIDNIDPNVASKVKKGVKVGNFSETDAFVRVSFEEMLAKLADGASKKGYAKSSDSKFPVIVDSTKYYDVSTGNLDTEYQDITSKLKVYDTINGTLQTPVAGLKLVIAADGSGDPILISERTMKASEFPNDFDFEGKTGTIPVIGGKFEKGNVASEAKLSQKVTGKLVKQPDGTYQVYTAENTFAEEEQLRFFGYGVEKGNAAEADWAGLNQNVTATAAVPRKGNIENSDPVFTIHSLIDTNIKFNFTKDNVVTAPPATKADVWYYNVADGYFYWCNVVKANETTSKSLINEVEFPAVGTEPTYYITSYNLWVGLESIPAAVAPLTAVSNEGKLTGTSTTEEPNKTWVSNNSGWGLGTKNRPGTGLGANDAALIKVFTEAATIVDIK